MILPTPRRLLARCAPAARRPARGTDRRGCHQHGPRSPEAHDAAARGARRRHRQRRPRARAVSASSSATARSAARRSAPAPTAAASSSSSPTPSPTARAACARRSAATSCSAPASPDRLVLAVAGDSCQDGAGNPATSSFTGLARFSVKYGTGAYAKASGDGIAHLRRGRRRPRPHDARRPHHAPANPHQENPDEPHDRSRAPAGRSASASASCSPAPSAPSPAMAASQSTCVYNESNKNVIVTDNSGGATLRLVHHQRRRRDRRRRRPGHRRAVHEPRAGRSSRAVTNTERIAIFAAPAARARRLPHRPEQRALRPRPHAGDRWRLRGRDHAQHDRRAGRVDRGRDPAARRDVGRNPRPRELQLRHRRGHRAGHQGQARPRERRRRQRRDRQPRRLDLLPPTDVEVRLEGDADNDVLFTGRDAGARS